MLWCFVLSCLIHVPNRSLLSRNVMTNNAAFGTAQPAAAAPARPAMASEPSAAAADTPSAAADPAFEAARRAREVLTANSSLFPLPRLGFESMV